MAKDWKSTGRGRAHNKTIMDRLEGVYKAGPHGAKQVTSHICVEGWSAIGSWTPNAAARISQLRVRRDTTRANDIARVNECKGGHATGGLQLTVDHAHRVASADPQ